MPARERITVMLDYDDVDRRWSISGSPSGPAGFVDLALSDDVEILVDATEPERLVELTGTLPGSDPHAVLPPPTQRLVAALLGKDVAGHLVRAVEEQTPLEIECQPTRALRAVGRLALLERLRETASVPSPWWAAEAALLATEVDHPSFVTYAMDQARQAAPALADVAHVSDRGLQELGEAIIDWLRCLAGVVAHLLDGPSGGQDEGDLEQQRRGVSLVLERLEALPALDSEESAVKERLGWARIRSTIQALDVGDLLLATPVVLPEGWQGRPDKDRPPVRVPLRAFREQIAPGAFQRFLPAGAMELTWSSFMQVQLMVPVQPGTRPNELEGVFVRIFDADSEELLCAAELELTSSHPAEADADPVVGALTADVELPRTIVVNGRRRAPRRLKVDLTSDPRIPPPSRNLRCRRKAIRAGMLAAAAGRLGDRRAAAQGWRSCAVAWHALGEHRQGRLAEAMAAETAVQRDRGARPQTAEWFAGECLPILLDAWADDQLTTAEQLAATDRPAAMHLARVVIEALKWSSPRLPLAAARLLLARLLAAEGVGWAAREQLKRARELYGRLNNAQGLDGCQQVLAKLPSERRDDPLDRRYAVGVSVLRGELVAVLTDQRGKVLDVRRKPLTSIAPTDVVGEVAAVVRQLLESGSELDEKLATRVIGLGVEFGGPVDHEAGEVVFYSPYRTDPAGGLIADDQTWKRVPFARLLAEETLIPSVVENDANALAAFALAFGRGQAQHFAVLLVGDGSGVGCGLVLDNKVYRGARGAAGEIGHIVVPGGRKCSSCERIGCLDSLASVRAILANIGQLKGQPPVPDLQTAIDLLRKGDKEAWDAFEEAGDALAHATADVLNVHSPSRIILRAPAAMLEPDNPFLQAFKTFKRDRFLQIPDDPEVFFEPLRLADGAQGVALLALQRSVR